MYTKSAAASKRLGLLDTSDEATSMYWGLGSSRRRERSTSVHNQQAGRYVVSAASGQRLRLEDVMCVALPAGTRSGRLLSGHQQAPFEGQLKRQRPRPQLATLKLPVQRANRA
jgi:hypothetical protein